MALDYHCTLQLVLLVLACCAGNPAFSQAPGDDLVTCEGSNQRIRASWVCDGNEDCENGADERRCARSSCDDNQFTCDDGQCIQYSWQCDGQLDCHDGSDETAEGHCAMTLSDTCRDFQFDCGNGHCIRRTYMCDGDPDCDNGADEEFSLCNPEVPLLECNDRQFTCGDHRFCIPLNWKCDGESDCQDNSDEDPIECGDVMGDCGFGFFNCSAGGCIDINLVCDGSYDCLRDGDNSDEEGCPTEQRCSTTEFRCPNREIGCIPLTWVCDGENDCGDESDEIGCVGVCLVNQVQCTTGGCVNSSQLCDDIIDCEDGSDEFTCAHDLPPFKCRRKEFRCYDNHQCVSREWVCDGTADCFDGSDEYPALCGTGSGHGESGVGGFDISGCRFSQCSQRCVEVDSTRDGYFCSCNSSSLIDQSNTSSCIDYDECSDPDRCSQVCRNTEGGYECSCANGYIVRPENRSECVAESDYPPANLLFANRVDIRAVETNGRNHEIRVKHLHNAIAVDFHYRLGYMFWTDVVQETINRALLNGTEVTTLVSTDLKDPDGLAVDWINDKLYWVDADTARIEVANLDGSNRTVLFANNIGILRAIVVDPTTRYFFWTDWGENPRIERASMDGTQRTVLHSEHLAWPNGLTMDYTTHTLYWIDAKVLTIESSFIDGSNRRPIRTVGLRHPFALTMFENSLYWSDWQRKSIFTTTKFARSFVRLDGLLFNKTLGFTDLIRENRTYTELEDELYFPMDVKVVHPLRQPEVANPCADNNGGCHYLCLLSATNEQGYSCACPPGISVADDGKSCAQLENFILVARRDEIFRISLDVPELIDVRLPLTNLSGAGGLDWDDGTDKIYWTDLRQDTINSANSNPCSLSQLRRCVTL